MGDEAKRIAALQAKREQPARSRILESMHKVIAFIMPLEQHLPPLLAATKYLREEQAATQGQKVGAVGFCMGGGLSGRLACIDPELAGAVICYGMAPSDEQIAKLACPLLGLYGGLDQRINAGLPALVESAKKHGKRFEHHVYEGAPHAFCNDDRPSYDVRASRDALARMLVFFGQVLVPPRGA